MQLAPARALLLVVLATALSSAAGAQDIEYLVSPNQVGLLIGEAQRLQVLDTTGREINEAFWSVEDGDDVISLKMVSARAQIQALRPGTAIVKATVAGREATATVSVYKGERLPMNSLKWGVPQLIKDTKAGRQVQSRLVSDQTPALYFQEGNQKGSYIRALAEDGIQQWVWPFPVTQEKLRLVCADNLGGLVLAQAKDGEFLTIVLREDGHERWRATTAPWWAYTYTPSNVLYVVEDHPDVPMLTGFAGETGERKVQIPLPANLTQHVSYVPPQKPGVLCAPGESVARSGPSSHGSLITDGEGFVHLAVTTLTATFDATGCVPGQPVDPEKSSLRVETHIQLVSISPTGESSWQTVRKLVQTVVGWEKPTEWLFPWGTTIPDGHGGVLIPVRGEMGSVHTGKAIAARGAILRVNQGMVQEFQMPLLPPTDKRTGNMLLGENDRGFYAGEKGVVAYNVLDGKVQWVWEYKERVDMYAALANGGVVIHLGPDMRTVGFLDANGKLEKVFRFGEATASDSTR